ncbi:TlpA disulfide reductase family protein [Hymenobacter convexus]|uniref:TlpA disulfide reductase family protein n=1 Tax=Hymenobacter sp. CA1UV-4 TaxID=3063782 RepID=UPI0027126985|nr:TlpA disulfide reductase family protein [Hymenobacter sp. CA1UV-4]MDO7854395.1 TlpA disulfide reductase family protein [Hymenobacter sp. CA1UV-4]
MQKTLMLSAALFGTFQLAQAQAPAAFVLRGTLPAVQEPAKVFLVRETLAGNAITDSAAVKKGEFVLRGNVQAPAKARLVLVPRGHKSRLYTGQADNAVFYLEKGTTVFTSPDSLAHAELSGSLLSTEYRELARPLDVVKRQQDSLYAAYRVAAPATRATAAFSRPYNARYTALQAQSASILTNFIKAHPNSLISLGAVKELAGPIPTYATAAPLFALLGPEVRQLPEAALFGLALQRLQYVAVGARAPNFEQPTADGKRVALASYLGKYVLVDFWASWCGPCRRENPNVVKLYEQFKNRSFEILGVSIDVENDRAQWLKAIADDHLAWTQVSDLRRGNAAATLYSVQAVPQNFLIDPNGFIVATNLHGDELRATLARLLPQP